MSSISGLPAHILFNHLVVVLMPLTAILLIVCALWAEARRRLIWLVLILAAVTLVVTPLTVRAGEWLGEHVDPSPTLNSHMSVGETGNYIAAGLFVAAALLAGLHVRLTRGRPVRRVLRWALVVLVIAVAGTTMVQVHRIGESGARAAWGGCCQ